MNFENIIVVFEQPDGAERREWEKKVPTPANPSATQGGRDITELVRTALPPPSLPSGSHRNMYPYLQEVPC